MIIGATLSFSDLDFIENHLQSYLSNALSNHLALLLVLGFHTVIFIAYRWWKQRQQTSENRQISSELGHLTAEEKLELLLDEVVELREALHERRVVEQTVNHELSSGRPREHNHDETDEMILQEEYQAEQKALHQK